MGGRVKRDCARGLYLNDPTAWATGTPTSEPTATGFVLGDLTSGGGVSQ